MTSEAELRSEANLRGSAAALRKTTEGHANPSPHHLHFPSSDADIPAGIPASRADGHHSTGCDASCADTGTETQ